MARRLSIFSIVALYCIFSSILHSQEKFQKSGGLARLLSMGQNPYVEDPQDLKANAAWGAYYDNFIWGDIGSTKTKWGNDGRSQFFGVNLRANESMTFGALLSRSDQISEGAISSVDPFYLNADSSALGFAPNNNTEIFMSLKTNNIAFGFGISYLSATRKSVLQGRSTLDEELNFSQFGFNAGFILDMGDQNKFESAVSLLFPKGKEIQSTSTNTMSQTLIKLDARGYLGLNDRIKFVPLMTLLLASGTDATTSTTGGSGSMDLPSRFQLNVGAGVQYRVENFLFAGGPSILLSKDTDHETKPETKASLTSLMWNLGAEWYATNLITARIGYKTMTGSFSFQVPRTSTTIDEYTQTVYGGDDGFTMGIGFRFNNFTLDASVNVDVIRQGLNNIGGGGATLGFLSTSYAF